MRGCFMVPHYLLVKGEMKMKSGIYQIICLTNTKVYIGSSVAIEKRWNEHRSDLRRNVHHSQHLQRAWNKYGEDVFVFEIIETVERDSLLKREQYYLDNLKPWDRSIGFNSCKRAENTLGFRHTKDSKRKMSLSRKGRKHTEETKRKMSEAQKGRKFSEESRKKMSESAKRRRKISEETRKKMSKAQKGRKAWNKGIALPEPVKRKISQSLKGRPSPNKGKKASENKERGRAMDEDRSRINLKTSGHWISERW